MFLKVMVALAVTFVGMGLVVRAVGAHVDSLVHPPLDLSLPQDVSEHAWTPVLGGHAAPGRRLRFEGGHVHSAACHADIGSYSVRVDHGFSFQPEHTRCRAGQRLQRTLAHATKASVSTEGQHEVLVLSSGHRTVLVLQARR